MTEVKAGDDLEARKAAFRRRLAALVNGGESRPDHGAPAPETLPLGLIRQCDHPLGKGRKCCHVKGAPAIGYELCPDDTNDADIRCWHPFPKAKLHRHSATWLHGSARLVKVGDWLVDPDTGEQIEAAPWIPEIIEEVRRDPFHYKPELDPNRHADARRALRLTVFNFALDNDDYAVDVTNIAEVKVTVEWHYHGASGWSYGHDRAGHSYELSPDGKVKRIYSLNECREALAFARRFGPTKAAQKLDIPVNTIKSWRRRRTLLSQLRGDFGCTSTIRESEIP